MRISDWSSDVCSSDLAVPFRCAFWSDNHNHPSLDMTEVSFRVLKHFFFGRVEKLSVSPAHFTPVSGQLFRFYSADCRSNSSIITFRNQYFNESSIARGFHLGRHLRSEEHTSELQSLMRISYAVFCLKKKTHTNHTHNSINT